MFGKIPAMLTRWLIPILSLGFAVACTASGSEPEKPEVEHQVIETPEPEATPEPKAEATPAGSVTVSVSSVQMIEDCPDTEAKAKAASRQSPRRRAKPGHGKSLRRSCSQSTVQLALENLGEAPVTVEIKAVRILAKGEILSTLATRKPKIWTDNRYDPWDQSLAPGQPSKASYKLGEPNWSEVERKLDGDSYGRMYTLEIDIALDGELQTIRSPEFAREKPHVIVT